MPPWQTRSICCLLLGSRARSAVQLPPQASRGLLEQEPLPQRLRPLVGAASCRAHCTGLRQTWVACPVITAGSLSPMLEMRAVQAAAAGSVVRAATACRPSLLPQPASPPQRNLPLPWREPLVWCTQRQAHRKLSISRTQQAPAQETPLLCQAPLLTRHQLTRQLRQARAATAAQQQQVAP